MIAQLAMQPYMASIRLKQQTKTSNRSHPRSLIHPLDQPLKDGLTKHPRSSAQDRCTSSDQYRKFQDHLIRFKPRIQNQKSFSKIYSKYIVLDQTHTLCSAIYAFINLLGTHIPYISLGNLQAINIQPTLVSLLQTSK